MERSHRTVAWLQPDGGPTITTVRAFAAAVVHADLDAAAAEAACRAFADRWCVNDLIDALRYARSLAPLPPWASQVLAALTAHNLRMSA